MYHQYNSFIHPFTAIIAGPTGSGKTEFIFKLLVHQNKLLHPTPDNIYYCYSIWQTRFLDFQKVNPVIEFIEGLPNIDEFNASNKKLLILDDLMREANDDSNVLDLFTKGSHHLNLSIILITQNLFGKGKNARTISLNSHYLILYKNPRDKTQISYLARQMYPKNSKFLEEAYHDATKAPHGYLLIDLKQATPDELRVQTNIFPHEEHIFYVNKKK